jgi:hypothetical protein
VVHQTAQALGRLRYRNANTALVLICLIALLAGCGSSSSSDKAPPDLPSPGLGEMRLVTCTDWKRGNVERRYATIAQIRKFAGGPVGSSESMKNGPILDDGTAYGLLDNRCAKRYARNFKLYRLYVLAAGFVGHQPGN